MQLPTHLSHSSRETLERCAKAYFLTRIAKAPQVPALWLVGGSAVHYVTEVYDLWSMVEPDPEKRDEAFNLNAWWEESFNSELAKARERESNENKWRSSKTEPVETWRSMGLTFVQAYIDWRERSPWEIWTTPDGEPAIELDVSGKLPGCPVEIKGFVDRVFRDPVFGKLWVLDLKSGKRPPKTAAQFETYAALIKAKYDVDVHMGVPFMNRKATLGKPYDLSEVDPKAIGAVYGAAWGQILKGDFRANGFPRECYPLCDVQAACAAQNGPLAHLYDPASPGYQPAF
ncbi:PD-(D/E)XK nuclease family protein [Streptomyces sp. NPDC038707]|uniref:RecB family exonuclease n=1 Tax=Streptomyces sp. NPDC038707 TaxID=3154329 RepID=UPI0033EE400E